MASVYVLTRSLGVQETLYTVFVVRILPIALTAISLLLTGCDILSLQPLYSEEDPTDEPAVVKRGKTVDHNTMWRVVETKPGRYSVVEDGTSGGQLKP